MAACSAPTSSPPKRPCTPPTAAWCRKVASRQHIRDLAPALDKALADSDLNLSEIDVVAATYGPGLAGALLTGLNTAKALAFSLNKPLLGVNHLEGHIYAAWLTRDQDDSPADNPGFPLACLVASGGHTDLILMEGSRRLSAGGPHPGMTPPGKPLTRRPAFWAWAFPGGPEIQRVSQDAAAGALPPLPRAWMRDTLDFSFSGVKTALLHLAQAQGVYPTAQSPQNPLDPAEIDRLVGEMAANFQESVVEVMVTKLLEMARRYRAKGIVLGGGVTANARLRQEITAASPLPVVIPPPVLCTDNGAMIAACAYFQYQRGQESGLELDIAPALPLG